MTSTTKLAQVKMIKLLFEKYGHVYIHTSLKRGKREWYICSSLNESFNFLLKKPTKIPRWIIENEKLFYHFLAGYSDAEGSWIITKDGKNAIRFEFCLASCDKTILEQIKNKLEEYNFKAYLNLRAKKGEKTNFGKHTKDYYGIVIHCKSHVLLLASKLLPLSHHKDKVLKMKFILENKNKKWDEIKDSLLELKGKIKAGAVK